MLLEPGGGFTTFWFYLHCCHQIGYVIFEAWTVHEMTARVEYLAETGEGALVDLVIAGFNDVQVCVGNLAHIIVDESLVFVFI